MKSVTFVGGSISALNGAIQLKKRGLDVVVIDPRAGQYTRVGDLDKKIFEQVQTSLDIPGVEIKPSEARHIKDLERSLYRIAQDMGVTIRRCHFDSFTEEGLLHVTDADTGSVDFLQSDLVFDCTGARHSVVNEVNRHMPGSFEVETISENPRKHQMMAYVRVSEDTLQALKRPSEKANDAVHNVLSLEDLREDFGWQNSWLPWMKMHFAGKNKICFYLDTPENLPTERLSEWLKAVLELRTGHPDIQFEMLKESQKGLKKMRLNSFYVVPQKVMKSYMGRFLSQTTNLPMVLPIGDAQISPDYRLGHGVLSAVARFKCLLNSMTVENDSFIIDLEKYQCDVARHIQKHEDDISKYYEKLTQRNFEELRRQVKIYQRALSDYDWSNDPDIVERLSARIREFEEKVRMIGMMQS